MTPAVLLLKRQRKSFTLHHYEHDANEHSYGEEAVNALNLNPARVFKTLLVELNGNPKELGVAVVPVAGQLDLKAFAKALGSKKAKMADIRIAENTTGYIQGGISPLGQKKLLPTVIEATAMDFPTIFFSGGKRGLQIELDPKALKLLLKARTAPISKL